MGYQFGTTGELRVGYEGGWQKFALQIGNPNELESFSGGYGATQVPIQAGSPGRSRSSLGRDKLLMGDFYWNNASPEAPNPYPVLQVASRNFFQDQRAVVGIF